MNARENTTSIFICGRPKVYCSSHDCGKLAARLCSFDVKREGKAAHCDRPVCPGCMITVDGREYCAAHGRVVAAKKATTRLT